MSIQQNFVDELLCSFSGKRTLPSGFARISSGVRCSPLLMLIHFTSTGSWNKLHADMGAGAPR